MRIAHLCLSCFYIDGFSYQENELVAQNVADGHDVFVIASTETYGTDRRLAYVEPNDYIGADGARVIRLPYSNLFPHSLARKLRVHPGVLSLLEDIKPDVILFHGLCGFELLTASNYKQLHPEIRLYVDSHEDFNNSARSLASKYLLHLGFYRPILHRSLDSIDKILCISVDTINFVRDFYRIPAEMLEFFPLGGKFLEDHDYEELRRIIRTQLAVPGQGTVFVQTGKIDRTKKLVESLRAFTALENPEFRFFVAGHLQDDIAKDVHALLRADERIRFLGWKTPDELRALLCAADVYVQPGTQSATMQMSLCCRCAVILDDVPSHRPFIDDNGWLVGSGLSLGDAFRLAAESRNRLTAMSKNSAGIASRLLDYRALAARLYS